MRKYLTIIIVTKLLGIFLFLVVPFDSLAKKKKEKDDWEDIKIDELGEEEKEAEEEEEKKAGKKKKRRKKEEEEEEEEEGKKEINCLDTIVLLEGPAGIKGTGFITRYKGKLYAVTNRNIIYQSMPNIITDIDNQNIKYTKMLVPDDGRDLVFFRVQVKDRNRPYLPMDEKVSSNCDIGTKVLAYGCRLASKSVTRAKGKITGVGTKNIEITAKIKDNLNGGPIVDAETGNVIAVVLSLESAKKSAPRGVRLDTIKKLKTINKRAYEDEVKRLYSISKTLVDFQKKVGKRHETVLRFAKKLSSKDLSLVLKDFQRELKANKSLQYKVKGKITTWQNNQQKVLDFFKQQYSNDIASAKQLQSRLEKQAEALKAIRKKYVDWRHKLDVDAEIDL